MDTDLGPPVVPTWPQQRRIRQRGGGMQEEPARRPGKGGLSSRGQQEHHSHTGTLREQRRERGSEEGAAQLV